MNLHLLLYLRKALLTCVLSLSLLDAHSQTAGAVTVSTIESKANSISQNDQKIAELNQKRMGSYAAEADRLLELKRQLSDLRAEKARALYELQNGFYCSQCNTPKSEFEARGENFQAHLRSVNGRAVPAKQEVIDQKMAEYDRRIAALEATVKKFEFEENEFSRRRDDWDRQLNELKNNNDRIREEIVELSKSFKQKVLDEAKKMHIFWAGDLMRTVAEKHFIEDRVNILNVKISDLQQEESKATEALKEKVRKKTDEDKQKAQDKINDNNQQLPVILQAYRERAASAQSQLNQWQTRITSVNADLLNPGKFSADGVSALESEKTDLETKITGARQQLTEYEDSYNKEHQRLTAENKTLSDKIWTLTTGLSKIQETALEGLRSAFATKRKILEDALSARRASLSNIGPLLSSKRESYRKKHLEYAAKLDEERIRMMRACQKAGCSCYGTDALGDVNGNWNRTLGCVGEMENAHFSGDPVYGCVEEGAIYRQHFNSLANGLSDSDMEALQRTSSKTRYDMIYKKITN
ncbi:hypothetical protein [uncultured Chitinophaga sp.]|uniref:hypothetical protein n=1 Tax=uncultured Chitinophaga sp. TaxID=339340 RepID=UPI0025E925AC|nr:hypothetical protein [uncultured Chitinophaga sp.]